MTYLSRRIKNLKFLLLLTFNLYIYKYSCISCSYNFFRRPFLVMCKHVHIRIYTLGLQRILIAYKKALLRSCHITILKQEPIQSVEDVFQSIMLHW